PLSLRWQSLLAITLVIIASVPAAQAGRVKRVPHVPRQRADQTETFTIAKDARIAVGSNHSASLGDLKVGDVVNIGYAQENGARIAHHIADGVQHKTLHTAKEPGSKTPRHAATSAMSHAHGTVQSMDVQARILTI